MQTFIPRGDAKLEKHLFSQTSFTFTENVQTDEIRFDEVEVMAMIRQAMNRYDMFKTQQSEKLKPVALQAPSIPRLVFLTWITEKGMPKKMHQNLMKWDSVNPDFSRRFFDDKQQSAWVKENYPDAWPAFSAMKLPAGRADLFRYCLMHKYGGVWSDVDIVPRIPLSKFLNANASLVVVHDGGMGSPHIYLYNAFMAATPGHPIMRRAIDIVIEHYNKRLRKRAVDCTGPGVLWRAVNDVQKTKPISFVGFESLTRTQYLTFRGSEIYDDQQREVLLAKYDGYLQDASTHGGEPHYGREVTWSN